MDRNCEQCKSLVTYGVYETAAVVYRAQFRLENVWCQNVKPVAGHRKIDCFPVLQEVFVP